MQLRPYQQQLKDDIVAAWADGHRDVLAVLPTGGGKTVLFSSVLADEPGACAAIAHRQELVSQMSLTLARNGVRHRVVGSRSTQQSCATLHMRELGYVMVDPNAKCGVCGIDTLVRMDPSDPWLTQVRLVVTDEGHHCLRENKWGKGLLLFPNARGLLVTATPMRADGKGLGRHADGVVDVMIKGPEMRWLMDQSYLTGYRIFCATSDIDLSSVGVTPGGDYSPPALGQAVKKSHIVGDIVANYQKFAEGKLGVTFCVNVEEAQKVADAYNLVGIPAAMVSGETPDTVRANILARFRNRQIMQLTSVDIFSEGFDLPAIEVVSFARPTQSFGLYAQQLGRALRPMVGKDRAIIIDHVGNVLRHGLPDAPRTWSLNRRERAPKGAPSDVVPLRICANETCIQPYERALVCCPYCGTEPVPAARASPAMVDGDLTELDESVLRAMRGEIAKVDGLPHPPMNAGPIVVSSIMKNHKARQDAQGSLRHAISLYGGWQVSQGRSVREAQKRFYLRYGVDVMTAQTLGKTDAAELEAKIRAELAEHGIIDASVNKVEA